MENRKFPRFLKINDTLIMRDNIVYIRKGLGDCYNIQTTLHYIVGIKICKNNSPDYDKIKEMFSDNNK